MAENKTQSGHLALIGLGPGSRDLLTARAIKAISLSQVVVGYVLYLEQITDLLAGKEVIGAVLGEEVNRARRAVDLALAGQRVALVSSGDIGIYGMAGLAYEVLRERGWHPGNGTSVEVIPGISALSSAAALLGAPLMHDFCAISLSDLLTPWDLITRRLALAAQGDFVIVLYNPASQKRRQQLAEAREILLRYRPPETPVGLVKNAYRDGQRTLITDLQHLPENQVGMLSTIIIGNSSTFQWDNLLVTPRGYSAKYHLGPGNEAEHEGPAQVIIRSGIMTAAELASALAWQQRHEPTHPPYAEPYILAGAPDSGPTAALRWHWRIEQVGDFCRWATAALHRFGVAGKVQPFNRPTAGRKKYKSVHPQVQASKRSAEVQSCVAQPRGSIDKHISTAGRKYRTAQPNGTTEMRSHESLKYSRGLRLVPCALRLDQPKYKAAEPNEVQNWPSSYSAGKDKDVQPYLANATNNAIDLLQIQVGEQSEICDWRFLNESHWMGAFCTMANRLLLPLGTCALSLETGWVDTVVCLCQAEYAEALVGIFPESE